MWSIDLFLPYLYKYRYKYCSIFQRILGQNFTSCYLLPLLGIDCWPFPWGTCFSTSNGCCCLNRPREVHIPGKMFEVGFKSWTCGDHWCCLWEHLMRKSEGSNSLENKMSSWQLLDSFMFLQPERNKLLTKRLLALKTWFGQMLAYKGWLFTFSSDHVFWGLLVWNSNSWNSPEQPSMILLRSTMVLILFLPDLFIERSLYAILTLSSNSFCLCPRVYQFPLYH